MEALGKLRKQANRQSYYVLQFRIGSRAAWTTYNGAHLTTQEQAEKACRAISAARHQAANPRDRRKKITWRIAFVEVHCPHCEEEI